MRCTDCGHNNRDGARFCDSCGAELAESDASTGVDTATDISLSPDFIGQVRAGILSAAEAESHPRKNELLRSVGVQPSVEVEVRDVDVRDGDRFLLCSDGLCGVVSESQISAIVGYEAPELAVRKLIDLANEHGGPDNITAQIASLPDGARLSAPTPLPVEAQDLRSRAGVGRLSWDWVVSLSGSIQTPILGWWTQMILST